MWSNTWWCVTLLSPPWKWATRDTAAFSAGTLPQSCLSPDTLEKPSLEGRRKGNLSIVLAQSTGFNWWKLLHGEWPPHPPSMHYPGPSSLWEVSSCIVQKWQEKPEILEMRLVSPKKSKWLWVQKANKVKEIWGSTWNISITPDISTWR